MQAESKNWIILNPLLGKSPVSRKVFLEGAGRLRSLMRSNLPHNRLDEIEVIRQDSLKQARRLARPAHCSAAISVLCDLAGQGWTVDIEGDQVRLMRPNGIGTDATLEKARVRAGLLVERTSELRIPSVRAFIRSMETRQLTSSGWVTIFDLMRDGESLARDLELAQGISSEGQRAKYLSSKIDPYLQFISADSTCEYTGFRLTDIWRYFRYTWLNVHKSTPGRSIQILIRDAAAKNHPIIGIAALSNAVVQQTERDTWIGWDPDTFCRRIAESPSKRLARWIHSTLEDLIATVYKEDLLRDKTITRAAIKHPTDEIIKALNTRALKEREQHHRFPKVADHKRNGETTQCDDQYWNERARLDLFVSKRLQTLARLLSARKDLLEEGFTGEDKEILRNVISSSKGKRAIATIVREAKGSHVGIDMMAITVCGAIPPYNHILGGKLVSMLMFSPKVVQEVSRRYSKSASIIASSIAGKVVVRKPKLVLLETTSLFGVSSSQYNRLKIPAADIGGSAGSNLAFIELKKRTKGFGSFHFSRTTIDLIEQMLAQSSQGRKVNSIFGEGVNPRFRKIRDGLQELGFPTDELLRHGDTRIIYMVPLVENVCDVLIGLSKKPRYLLPMERSSEATKQIVGYWVKRWLTPRVMNCDVIIDVAKHSLAYPVAHGAKVQIPVASPGEEELLDLFDH